MFEIVCGTAALTVLLAVQVPLIVGAGMLLKKIFGCATD